jgi:hypothetical protein
MLITFNTEIFPVANSSDYIYPFKLPTTFYIPDNISTRRTRAYSRCKKVVIPLSSTYTRLLTGALFILELYSARSFPVFS